MSSPPPTEDDLNVDYPYPGSNFKLNAGIVVPELLRAAAYALEKPLDAPQPSIRIFAHGSFAKIFLITFSDGTEVVARAPYQRDFAADRVSSEVATMVFARERLGLPVPRLFAWAVTRDNPAGAPYLLMERLPGVKISASTWFRKLTRDEKKRVLENVAEVHARLVQPLPFQEVGNIYLSDLEQVQPRAPVEMPPERFKVGPFVRSQKFSMKRDDVPIPQTSFCTIVDYWKALADVEFFAGRERWARAADQYIIPEEDAGWELNYRPQTTADFADAFRDLGVILGAYRIPAEFSSLCLWHNDFSLRNFLMDPTTFEVTGLLDWEDASVVPVHLAPRCPDEIEQNNSSAWWFFPDEWVAFRPREDDQHHGGECMDSTWDRWYYSNRVAQHDPRFGARLWRESERSLKLHELLIRGWVYWLEKREWLTQMANALASGGGAPLGKDLHSSETCTS